MLPPKRMQSVVTALPLELCLAKTRTLPDGQTGPGRTVEEHCRIAGAVALELLARMPAVQRALFPELAWLGALLHDIGKVCPGFQAQLYKAAGEDVAAMPELRAARYDLLQMKGGHAVVGMVSLLHVGAPESFAQIVGAHHGRIPPKAILVGPATQPLFGGPAWQEGRRLLLERLMEGQPGWPGLWSEAESRLVTGLTVVADWIASGPLFDDPANDWRPLVSRAVSEAGFIPFAVKAGLSFKDVFSFAPRPIQQSFYTAVHGPGIYTLEAPMGLGKTEAALYAAYCMLAAGTSSGCYFALPTQITSNRIYDRINAFLGRILVDHGRALLLHGKSWLHECCRQILGAEAAPGHSWFSQGRRGLLAPFAVGTVDQALLAAMHVRHAPLRDFGLAGKTVILDEVHSYDAYTGGILDALVKQLLRNNCTVIILSATLTHARRALLMGVNSPAMETADAVTAYPSVSARSQDAATCTVVACPSPPPARVLLRHVTNDAPAVEEALKRAEQGQRVLWVENTVRTAQDIYTILAARAAALAALPVGLLHSRFTPWDREHNEAAWTALFAPDAPGRGRQGCILVGTQVVEQSLDLDADFLLTRFCPTDMLLQRLGRLWRHAAQALRPTPRPPEARCEAWLLRPDLDLAQANPSQAFGPSGYVYLPYVLCRSLEQWHTLTEISLPTDIRPILERTYAERKETATPLARALQDMLQAREDLNGKARQALSALGQTGADTTLPTRINQRPEVEVLLFRSWNPTWKGLLLADESQIDLKNFNSNLSFNRNSVYIKHNIDYRAIQSAHLTLNTVRVPAHEAPPFEAITPLDAWVDCRNLRVACIRPDDSLCSLDGLRPEGKRLLYRKDTGYRAE